jgi:hypothetical protein
VDRLRQPPTRRPLQTFRRKERVGTVLFLAAAVPRATRTALGVALQQARIRANLKLATVGAFMGGISAESVHQMEAGERKVDMERIALAGAVAEHDADARRFVDAFLRCFAALCGVEDFDAVSEQLRITNSLIVMRMAKAELQEHVSNERKRA